LNFSLLQGKRGKKFVLGSCWEEEKKCIEAVRAGRKGRKEKGKEGVGPLAGSLGQKEKGAQHRLAYLALKKI